MSLPDARPAASSRPMKRRRTATSVFAGEFDPRPPRDVLTSLLNGVGPYKVVEKELEERRIKRRERKAREKERMRSKKLKAGKDKGVARSSSRPIVTGTAPVPEGRPLPNEVPTVNTSTSLFWRSRGTVFSPPRSISPSPPPDSGFPHTPGPSDASYESRTSSKRPHTPDDGFSLFDHPFGSPPAEMMLKIRKKRSAARKGWKGWVEGSPPPSDKLINLDLAPVILRERRLRSGKNFDAICEGQDSWVRPW